MRHFLEKGWRVSVVALPDSNLDNLAGLDVLVRVLASPVGGAWFVVSGQRHGSSLGRQRRFGCPKSRLRAIVKGMTTPQEVRIAGVPWPVYKLAALAVGVLVLLVVAASTVSVGPAVVAGAASAAVVWLGLGVFSSRR